MSEDENNMPKKAAHQDGGPDIWGGAEHRKQAQIDAMECLVKAQTINRFWTFEIDGKFEVAFGNYRGLSEDGGSGIHKWAFSSAASLDIGLAKLLHNQLGIYIEKQTAGAAQSDAKAKNAGGDVGPADGQ